MLDGNIGTCKSRPMCEEKLSCSMAESGIEADTAQAACEPAASKAVVRTVISLTASVLFTVASAFPA